MKCVPAPGLRLAALFLAAAASARAGLMELPGAGKAKKAGYVITVEGGEDGTQSVYYDNDGKRMDGPTNPLRPAASPVPAAPGPASRTAAPKPAASPVVAPAAPSPVITAESHAVVAAEEPDKYAGGKELGADPAVNRFTERERNLSEKSFDRTVSASFGKDEKYAGKDALTYGRWGRSSSTFEKETAPGVSFSEKFSAERVDKETVTFERRERERFARDGEKAEIPAWTERFAGGRNARFVDDGSGSGLRDRVATGYMTLMQVSMQDINRTNFRRNHATEKGDLPVGRIGAGSSKKTD